MREIGRDSPFTVLFIYCLGPQLQIQKNRSRADGSRTCASRFVSHRICAMVNALLPDQLISRSCCAKASE